MIPQQDARKALIEKLREAIRAAYPGGCRILSKGGECECLLCALEALSESSVSSEKPPTAALKERLRVALTEKAFHSCRVGPMLGPMRDEPAILLSNAIDALCNVMDATSETQEDRSAPPKTEPGKLPMLVGRVEAAPLEDVITWALHPDIDHGTIGSQVMQRLARTLIDTNEALSACQAQTGGALRETLESALTLGVQYGLVEAQQNGVLKSRAWIVEQADRLAAEAQEPSPSQPAETPEERKDATK
jgi:hypothetical protein